MILPSRYTPSAQPGEPGLAKSLNTSSTAAADFSSEFLFAALLAFHKSRIAANPLAALCQQAMYQLLFGFRAEFILILFQLSSANPWRFITSVLNSFPFSCTLSRSCSPPSPAPSALQLQIAS